MFIDGPRHPSEFLEYNSSDGALKWRVLPASMFKDGAYSAIRRCNAWNGRQGGKAAFTAIDNHGYRQGNYMGVHMRIHKIIWMLEHNRIPTDRIDYIDGIRDNTQLDNLREASCTIDGRNAGRKSNNTSGHTGVIFDKARGKWRSQIKVSGQSVYLGRFNDKNNAVIAYEAAKVRYGFSPRHGRPDKPNTPTMEA